ncbi:MAG TPA: twin-arginine translocase subunit TatC [Candidatus Dormibacteraeota bacterium]|nr:twin-arginine translocase subunit TatC [Candidatus Dormibacteraeota bacterium]
MSTQPLRGPGPLAILRRHGSPAGPGEDDRQLTLVEHLTELRRVLIVCLIAWGLATALAFVFNHAIIRILEHPLLVALGHTRSPFGTHVIYTGPIEGLSIPFKVASLAGIVLALPVILWQLWTFVAPALHRRERRLVGPFIGSSVVLFVVGAGFAYFVMPIGLTFLATFLGGDAVYLPDLNSYLTFFGLLIVIFGVTFELPVVLCLLGAVGILSSLQLRRWRRAAIFIIIAVALIITPGADPFTPTLLSVPLILLYEGSILIIRLVFHR